MHCPGCCYPETGKSRDRWGREAILTTGSLIKHTCYKEKLEIIFVCSISILILLRCWVVNLFLRLFMDQFIYWLDFYFYPFMNIHLWASKDYFERKYDYIILSTFKYSNVYINMYIASLTFIPFIGKLTNKIQANSEDCDYFYSNNIKMLKQEVILFPCYK